MLIRFITPTYQGPWGPWAKIGLEFIKAIHATGKFPVRIISPWNFLATDPEWDEVKPLFLTPYSSKDQQFPFINVVCGMGDLFNRFWTQEMPNIALTGVEPRPPNGMEIGAINKFDYLFTPEGPQAALALIGLGIKVPVTVMPPSNVGHALEVVQHNWEVRQKHG